MMGLIANTIPPQPAYVPYGRMYQLEPFLPNKQYIHGLVGYTEHDILLRESIIAQTSSVLKQLFEAINPRIKMWRVEAPILTQATLLQTHIEANFELLQADELYLRPETTRGTFEMLKSKYPQNNQLVKNLPICVWQAGKSFRNEQTRPFSELRFKEFYQLEYQLVYSSDTKADYFNILVPKLADYFSNTLNSLITVEEQVKLPHYSKRTTDLYCKEHEIAGISERDDFDHPVVEIAIGLDRVTHLIA